MIEHACYAGVAHCDIANDNVMISNKQVKIIDFSVARLLTKDKMTGRFGREAYMAPEVYANLPYTEKADVFPVGVLLHQFLSGGTSPIIGRTGTHSSLLVTGLLWCGDSAAFTHSLNNCCH